MYKYSCDRCDNVFEYPEDIMGRKIECPTCMHKFVITTEYKDTELRPRKIENSSSRSGSKSFQKTSSHKRPERAPSKPKNNTVIFLLVLIIVVVIGSGGILLFRGEGNVPSRDEVVVNKAIQLNNETPSKELGSQQLISSEQALKIKANEKSEYRELLRQSCELYELLRTEHGFYLDMIRTGTRKPDYRVSAASTGVGLVSLCIADKLGFDKQAEKKILISLRACAGEIHGLKPERNKTGYFRHFFDARTGVRWGKSEFSTIDTALLISGVLFCKNNFPDNLTIQSLAKELWGSIDWSTSKADKYRYYLTQDEAGVGGPGKTRIFNEYILLADYCSLAAGEQALSDMHNWPRKSFSGYDVLTDTKSHFLPLFTFQFPLYLSPARTIDKQFLEESLIAAEADRLWWKQETSNSGLWGSSAGAGLKGYSVDSTTKNADLISCAPSIAGFMPFDEKYKKDFDSLLKNHKSITYKVDDVRVPWRISYRLPSWRAGAIQGIDFAPMLFGLAALEENLGFEFFQKSSQLTWPIK
jgi:DNA-directed RNA polymerase subunit RPC12/RpoP